jgi:hypothetical protein
LELERLGKVKKKKGAKPKKEIDYSLLDINEEKIRAQIISEVRKIQHDNWGKVKLELLKNQFYYWLMDTYGVESINGGFFTRTDSVFNGTHRGLKSAISVEDLFDMWKRKKNELDRIYTGNVKKGNKMDVQGRLIYDLAILVGKYDSYVKFKNSQKILSEDVKKEIEQINKIDFSNINTVVANQQKAQEKEEQNINDLLDEVF